MEDKTYDKKYLESHRVAEGEEDAEGKLGPVGLVRPQSVHPCCYSKRTHVVDDSS